jgi:hypothetical protein
VTEHRRPGRVLWLGSRGGARLQLVRFGLASRGPWARGIGDPVRWTGPLFLDDPPPADACPCAIGLWWTKASGKAPSPGLGGHMLARVPPPLWGVQLAGGVSPTAKVC